MGFEIDKALTYMVEREGSDLHVKVDSPPVARVHGDLWALQGSEPLTEQETEQALQVIASQNHLAEFASTRRMRQLGQVAETMSTSREISWAQPPSAAGGVDPPFWLTFLKQPLPVVQAESP